MVAIQFISLSLVAHLVFGDPNKCMEESDKTKYRCTQFKPDEYDWMCCKQPDTECGYFKSMSDVKTEDEAITDMRDVGVSISKRTKTYDKWSDCTLQTLCRFKWFEDRMSHSTKTLCTAENHGHQRTVDGILTHKRVEVVLEPILEWVDTGETEELSGENKAPKAWNTGHCLRPPFIFDDGVHKVMLPPKKRISVRRSPPVGGSRFWRDRIWFSEGKVDEIEREKWDEIRGKPGYESYNGKLWKAYEGSLLKIIQSRSGHGKHVGLALEDGDVNLRDICCEDEKIYITIHGRKDSKEQYGGSRLHLEDGKVIYKIEKSVNARIEYYDVDRADYQSVIPNDYRRYYDQTAIQFVYFVSMVFAVLVCCLFWFCTNLGIAISCYLFGKQQMTKSNGNHINVDYV